MKRKILSILTVIGFSAFGFAQDGIQIYVEGQMTDMSSGQGVIQVQGAGGVETVTHLVVENNTGGQKDWVITRLRINEQPNWTDYFCWGHETDPFGGTCYAAQTANPWTSPGASSVIVGDGEAGNIDSYVEPNASEGGTVTYRYYVSEDGQTFDDSVDIEVSFNLSLNEAANVEVSVGPNPASENLTIKASGTDGAVVKMVDVLGNVVLREKMSTVKTIDVSTFRNGIYFVSVYVNGVKTHSKKIIVRH